jgi:hypothetical protein
LRQAPELWQRILRLDDVHDLVVLLLLLVGAVVGLPLLVLPDAGLVEEDAAEALVLLDYIGERLG